MCQSSDILAISTIVISVLSLPKCASLALAVTCACITKARLPFSEFSLLQLYISMTRSNDHPGANPSHFRTIKQFAKCAGRPSQGIQEESQPLAIYVAICGDLIRVGYEKQAKVLLKGSGVAYPCKRDIM